MGPTIIIFSSTAKVPYVNNRKLVDWKAYDIEEPFHRVTFNVRQVEHSDKRALAEGKVPH